MIKKDHEKLLGKPNICTKEVLEAKNDYIFRMINKINDTDAVPKFFWAILNCFDYNKNNTEMPFSY